MSFDVSISLKRSGRMFDYTFKAEQGGLTALFGPSGAGKTTLLDMIAGLVRPSSGHIVISDDVVFDRERRIDLPPERRRCGYVFQDLRLFPHRNVRENLLYGWRLAVPEHRWLDLDTALDVLGIGHLLGRRPATLSGGEAQRVAIGRALLSGPRVLLMDEPLASVDAERRDEILRVIERVRDELRLPILYVSHDRAEVDRLADRVIAIGAHPATLPPAP
ncbi:molybdate transport system ATP-binding protein [Novosphingobium sp. PhB165]|uniref:molybdenum ABC transporter ATP-binding protein n=1 Tax=Novosphingobium sp. PhB165 TaxID=2485105 RepID=UPI0010449D2E|nr:ATP-binding cassette domain-containing protein [Novosphingobium sp. PhB165]TCM22334.1 molybdate transport system ATP-binding protein [Novosphingobium sp. PhB165]